MSPEQCKAARFLLGWTQRELAEKSEVTQLTVHRFETGQSRLQRTTKKALKSTLQEAGIRFLESAGEPGEPRVILRDGSGVALGGEPLPPYNSPS